MDIKLYKIDAFTDRLFTGNPAAVCPLKKWLPDSILQQIAAENNLSETAFFVLSDSETSLYELRWFTPELEIDLCGHATLATAHVIFTEIFPELEKIRFHTKQAGELKVTHQRSTGLYTLDFPARPGFRTGLPNGLLTALRSKKTPIAVFKARDHMLVYENENDIEELSPDFMALDKIDSIFGVIVTAPGNEVDFVSRYFTPNTTISEDPVTGSAHCTLVPYWSERLHKDQLHAYQISSRRGELWCQNQGERILISGKAVNYLKSKISCPAILNTE